MKRYLLALIGLAAIAACITASGAVGSRKSDVSSRKSNNANIYYKTQAEADAALARFDKDNPDCQLWTNWQKLCSRTGEGGAAFCSTDREKQVAPSKVFCSKSSSDVSLEEGSTNSREQISRDRFCTSFDSDSPLSKRLGRPICADLDINRPFSGHRISSRIHPWCKSWKDKDGFGIVNDKNHISKFGYYCAEIEKPSWCAAADGFGLIPVDSPDHPKYGTGEIQVLGTIDHSMNASVVGIVCRKRK